MESSTVAIPSLERTLEFLREVVGRYRVCWEVLPEYIIAGHERRQIGFTLELSATHAPGVEHPSPGCRHCQEVFAALQTVAAHILPREKRDSVYRIEPYDQAIHYSRARKDRPDVALKIGILHRTGFERPVDACEVRCLTEMKQRLAELGACEGQWRSRKENR
jgi:hypothetical protein